MLKKALFTLLLVISILSVSACNSSNQAASNQKNIYNFEDYENSEVFDIDKINTREDLSKTCTTYKFTYLSDNYKIKAYISLPVSAIESQQPTKCVLYNRGGNSKLGWLDDNSTATICSACSRVVIASQYREADGSEGKDQFGGDDLNDVIKLIDLCQNQFSFIDMDDFCVAGISRGGMMTYLTARSDSRVKRIVAVSAVSDLFQAYKEREDMQRVLYNHIGCTPTENPTEYEKRSAIRWSEEIKVPVLIIHSKNDEQVSYEQAEAMYEKLKDTTDCKFISHDDNVHGIHPEDLKIINEWLEP